MNRSAWTVAPVLALLAFSGAPAAARATPAPQTVTDKAEEGADKTKDARAASMHASSVTRC